MHLEDHNLQQEDPNLMMIVMIVKQFSQVEEVLMMDFMMKLILQEQMVINQDVDQFRSHFLNHHQAMEDQEL
jgi:hypothetical protein